MLSALYDTGRCMRQSCPNCHSEGELLQPFVRKGIRIAGLLISAYVVGVILVDGSFSFVLGLLFAMVGLGALFFCTKRGRIYYSPLIITGFYILGYMLSFAQVLLNKENVLRVGFGAIGDFMFTDSSFIVFLLIVVAGMGGVLTATLVAERIFKHKRGGATGERSPFDGVSEKRLYKWILIWGVFSLCLMLLMWSLEIGRTGLIGKTQLPFRLVGILLYVKMIFVPFCGTLFLDICLRRGRKRPAILVLTLLIVIGAIGSLGATSRGTFVFTVFPAIVFLLFTSHRNNLNQKLFVIFSSVSILLAGLVAFVVEIVRGFVFAKMTWDLTSSLSLLKDIGIKDIKVFEMIQILLSLMTERIGGARELMAVVGSNISGISIPIQMFMGSIDPEMSASITNSVMGFVPYSDETVGFGITFGMWGQLFLSRSYLVVFGGTILLVAILICFEEVFLRKGLRSVALLFAILLGFQFWGSASMFVLSRFAAITLVCYFTVVYIGRRGRKFEKDNCPG